MGLSDTCLVGRREAYQENAKQHAHKELLGRLWRGGKEGRKRPYISQ
jgi:hypothetical protein